ncbi:hypothetical protein [Ideonella sp. B508-1]|uniref:hypothetical protein n=1 Tax=Ideonella sp. B508-1 TaxID=137716 RepID=UPI0011D1D571|nr:hypothetical protein [Ideonella sp. B508-1]
MIHMFARRKVCRTFACQIIGVAAMAFALPKAGATAVEPVGAEGVSVQKVYAPDHRSFAFIRHTPEVLIDTGIGELEAAEIWTSRSDGSDAKLLLRGRPGKTPQETLAELSEIQFSPDGRQLFFLSAAWTTSGAVHVVQVDSGEEHFVCPGNSLEVIQRGKYAGYLMVRQHRYAMGGGSYDWLWLLTPEGKDVAPISMDDDAATEMFRKMYVDPAGR